MRTKTDFFILGASGMQGRIVARDLLERGYRVVLADLHKEGSEKNLKRFPKTAFVFIDLRNEKRARSTIRRARAAVVVNCAEGNWNLSVYTACLRAGSHVLDLGSEIPMTRDQLAMNDAFRKANLVAITGCGSTPGVNNVMLKFLSRRFSRMTTIEAGFAWDANMKVFVVPFSVESIVEELSDPAPYIENKEWKEALPSQSEEERTFREIGEQKSFIVRHPETLTFWEYYKDKGLENVRFYAGFPEHSLHVFHELIGLGFGGKNPVDIEGVPVRPIDAATEILRRVPFPEGYTEKENLWVCVKGLDERGAPKSACMECIVSTIAGWEDAGCNIDTGLPCSIMAQMVLDGRVTERGSFAPESVIPERELFRELAHRGMTVYEDGNVIAEADGGMIAKEKRSTVRKRRAQGGAEGISKDRQG